MNENSLFCVYCRDWVSIPHSCTQVVRGTAHNPNISGYRVEMRTNAASTEVTFDGGRISGRRSTYYRQK